MAVDADDQWQDVTGHRKAMTGQTADRRMKPGHSSRRRRDNRASTNKIPKSRQRATVIDSTPLMVADFTLRKQIEWLTENMGVRDDFKDVAQKIWFR